MDGLQKEEVKTRYTSPGIGAEAEQTWFLEVFCYPPNVTKAKLVLSNQYRTVRSPQHPSKTFLLDRSSLRQVVIR
jgi:hypothetical protein